MRIPSLLLLLLHVAHASLITPNHLASGCRHTHRRGARSSACVAAMDAAERAAQATEAMEEADAAMGDGAGLQYSDIAAGPTTYPLAAVVGQEAIKTALLLCGVNPEIGGVVISGSRGTAKSVMARAIHSLLPPIEVVKGNEYNLDKDSLEYDSFTQAKIDAGELKPDDLETEIVPAPFVQARAPLAARRALAPNLTLPPPPGAAGRARGSTPRLRRC